MILWVKTKTALSLFSFERWRKVRIYIFLKMDVCWPSSDLETVSPMKIGTSMKFFMEKDLRGALATETPSRNRLNPVNAKYG